MNARELLRLLEEHGPCSRADLVRYSGLSAPSVTSTVGMLTGRGLVLSLGDGVSGGGRPPEVLRFRAERGYVASADVGGTRVRMMLADLSGAPVAQWSTLLKAREKRPEGVCGVVAEGLRALCQTRKLSSRKVLHLAVGAPGITDVAEGVVLAAPNLREWSRVPLRSMLTKVTGVPVSVENDVNLAALGEHWRGSARGVDDFVFVAMGTGVGAGVVLRGEIHHGRDWTAGEVGYFHVREAAAEPVKTHKVGQLEQRIGGEGLERRWRELLRGRGSRKADARIAELRPRAIFDLAQAGDAIARTLLEETADILADALTDVAMLLDPELIVLGGGVGAHPELARATHERLSQNEFGCPSVRLSALGAEAQLFGGVQVALAETRERLLLP